MEADILIANCEWIARQGTFLPGKFVLGDQMG